MCDLFRICLRQMIQHLVSFAQLHKIVPAAGFVSSRVDTANTYCNQYYSRGCWVFGISTMHTSLRLEFAYINY